MEELKELSERVVRILNGGTPIKPGSPIHLKLVEALKSGNQSGSTGTNGGDHKTGSSVGTIGQVDGKWHSYSKYTSYEGVVSEVYKIDEKIVTDKSLWVLRS
jgi:hypothetical protein